MYVAGQNFCEQPEATVLLQTLIQNSQTEPTSSSDKHICSLPTTCENLGNVYVILWRTARCVYRLCHTKRLFAVENND